VKVETISRSQPFVPSGNNLLVALACLLLLGTIVFDLSFDRFTWQTSTSLFLTICAVISGGLGFWVVPILQRLKTGQIVREDGPKAHLQKAGTPTMGGIFFLPVAIIIASVQSQLAPDTIAVALVTFCYGFIGWLDDWQVLRRQSNKGISPQMKLLLQIVVAVLFCLWMLWFKSPALTTISLPGGLALPLGWLFWLLAGFVLVAESNATNLTDGVDGLAAGTSAIALWGLGIVVAASNPDLTIFCICLSGSCVGFLVHNSHKAKVFMGDTGSLALGAAFATVGLLSNNLWALFIVSGLFFLESLSVIAQVVYYKATKDKTGRGKRLLKMAPIHHHFELSGWSETQVVGVFYVLNLLLVAIAYYWH
jgi:phospho-N-acetylmuramoyl-pentapeptide-transferase